MGAATTNNFVIYKMKSNKFSMGSGLLSTGAVSKNFFDSNAEFSLSITGGVAFCHMLAAYVCYSSISNLIGLGGDRFFSVYSRNNIVDNCLLLGYNDSAIYDAGNIFKNTTFAFLKAVNAAANNTFENCIIKNTAQGVGDVAPTIANVSFTNCTFQYNGSDSYISEVKFYNCEFLNQVNGISMSGNNSVMSVLGGSESFDHQKIANAYYKASPGGVIQSQASVLPEGYSLAYIHTLTNALIHSAHRIPFTVYAGQTITIEVQLRKSASMTYLPRVYLMKGIENPLTGITPVDSFTMTDSTDTWESDTFTIDNSAGTYDKQYVLWFIGKNATGNMYSAYKINPPSGGGGAVSIVPFGGIRL